MLYIDYNQVGVGMPPVPTEQQYKLSLRQPDSAGRAEWYFIAYLSYDRAKLLVDHNLAQWSEKIDKEKALTDQIAHLEKELEDRNRIIQSLTKTNWFTPNIPCLQTPDIFFLKVYESGGSCHCIQTPPCSEICHYTGSPLEKEADKT